MPTNNSKHALELPALNSYYPHGMNPHAPGSDVIHVKNKTGGAITKESKKRAKTFCNCIKRVRKTLRNVKKSKEKEQRAIAICVRAMQKKYDRTLKKFSCRDKTMLETQPLLRKY